MVSVELWWSTPRAAENPELSDLLDARERARRERFRFQADQDRYTVAHALARLVVARLSGRAPDTVEFSRYCANCASGQEAPADRRELHGKPYPLGAASGVELSISHSGDRVVVAAARKVPLGVDVEQVSSERDLAGLAGYALTEAERNALLGLPPDVRTEGFFTYWARKEASLKATGEGLGGGLASVEVSGADAAAAVVSWKGPHPPGAVQLLDLDAGSGYRSALAALTPEPLRSVSYDAGALLAQARRHG